MPDKLYNTIKIRLKDNNLLPYIKKQIFLTKHFENILLILIYNDYKQNYNKNFSYLTNGRIMRAVLYNTSGGQLADKVQYIKDFYKYNHYMKSLIKVAQELKSHNIVEQIKDVKKNYDSFFTKLKKGDTKAKPPKPKKLSKISNATLCLDSDKSFSLKRKNTLGLNLNNKMKYTHINHKELAILVGGNLKNIQSINLNYNNGFIYLLISYIIEEPNILENNDITKSSGIDIGINNLIALYIKDNTTPSLIISGVPYKTYNANFNRFISKLNNSIAICKDEKHKKYLQKYRTFLYEKRNNFFFNEWHRLSKRILQYLQKYNVTELKISRNLSELKYNGNCELRKEVKQTFIQIPLIKLLDMICVKAYKYEIKIIEVDEKYTSKTSCISQDINYIQKLSEDNKLITNDLYKGSRVKRGLFYDKVYNKIINSDINGAVNICNIDTIVNLNYNIPYRKLCNPIKVYKDTDLLKLVS